MNGTYYFLKFNHQKDDEDDHKDSCNDTNTDIHVYANTAPVTGGLLLGTC